jgi:hypothetical protein
MNLDVKVRSHEIVGRWNATTISQIAEDALRGAVWLSRGRSDDQRTSAPAQSGGRTNGVFPTGEPRRAIPGRCLDDRRPPGISQESPGGGGVR